jgi:hypothetical protein
VGKEVVRSHGDSSTWTRVRPVRLLPVLDPDECTCAQ